MAATGAPMSTPVPVFSAMLRLAVAPSSKVGFSFTLVTLMVTAMVSVPPFLSSAVTVTE